MKNVIIVHGKPSKEIYYSKEFPSSSNFAWIPWVQKQLLIEDIKADTPEMMYAYEPDYEIWKKELERFDITEKTSLVGHSAGAGFILRFLSENHRVVDKIVLIAPHLDPKKKSQTGFLEFEIDPSLENRASTIVVFRSDNDSEGVSKSIETIINKLPNTKIQTFYNYGHFIPRDIGKIEFPELIETLTN